MSVLSFYTIYRIKDFLSNLKLIAQVDFVFLSLFDQVCAHAEYSIWSKSPLRSFSKRRVVLDTLDIKGATRTV